MGYKRSDCNTLVVLRLCVTANWWLYPAALPVGLVDLRPLGCESKQQMCAMVNITTSDDLKSNCGDEGLNPSLRIYRKVGKIFFTGMLLASSSGKTPGFKTKSTDTSF